MKSWKAFVLLSVLILSACKDTPNSFGDDFIPVDDRYKFQQVEANSTKDSTYYSMLKPETISKTEGIVIGKLGDFESSALLKFPLSAPDSIKTMLNEGKIEITSTWVQMVSLYSLGDKNSNFNFTVNKLTNEVDFNNVSAANFSNITYDPADIGSSKEKIFTDTMTTFWLNTSVVKDWIKVQYDSLNTPRNYGVILKPTSSTAKVMAYLGYETSLGMAPKVFFEFKKGNTYTDTLSAFATLDTYYAKQSAPTQTDKFITIQGTISYKNKIKFDLPQLPSNAVMNKATLELNVSDSTLIASSSKSTYGSMGALIKVGRLTSSTGLAIDTMSSNILIRQTAPNRNKYLGDITSYAQTWINKGNNYGLIISLNGEEYDASQITFYGSKCDNIALRPKLTITYSIRNKD